MIRLIYILILVLLISCKSENEISTTLEVTINKTENELDLFNNSSPSIVQKFYLRNYQSDTFYITLKNCGRFEEYLSKFINKDSVYMAEDGDTLIHVYINDKEIYNYLYADNWLKIPLSNSQRDSIEICYDYWNFDPLIDYKFVGSTFSFVGFRCFQDEDSWYFEYEPMKWKNVSFYTPENIEIISNYPLTQNHNVYTINFKNTVNDPDGIWFYALRTDLLDKKQISAGNNTINHYFQKHFDIDSTTQTLKNIQPISEDIMQKQLFGCKERCEQIMNFLGDTLHRTINVFMCDRKGGGIANPGTNGIFCALYNEQILSRRSTFYLHELIHCFQPLPAQKDTIYYLFVEGITVYIDKLIQYGDSSQVDSLFTEWYSKISEQSKNTPLLNLTDEQDRDGEIAYIKGPYVLFQMAKRIGLERFNSLIKNYYALLRRKNEFVTLTGFEQFLKANGVSDEDWDYFIKLIS